MCICMCAYIRIYIRMCVCVRTCVCVCVYTCICTCRRVYVNRRVCERVVYVSARPHHLSGPAPKALHASVIYTYIVFVLYSLCCRVPYSQRTPSIHPPPCSQHHHLTLQPRCRQSSTGSGSSSSGSDSNSNSTGIGRW
jgi:hypothetical protein